LLSASDLVVWMRWWRAFRLFQLSVLPKAVMGTEPTSSSCKFGVLMNRWPHFWKYLPLALSSCVLCW
jgi:hypothetical protein